MKHIHQTKKIKSKIVLGTLLILGGTISSSQMGMTASIVLDKTLTKEDLAVNNGTNLLSSAYDLRWGVDADSFEASLRAPVYDPRFNGSKTPQLIGFLADTWWFVPGYDPDELKDKVRFSTWLQYATHWITAQLDIKILMTPNTNYIPVDDTDSDWRESPPVNAAIYAMPKLGLLEMEAQKGDVRVVLQDAYSPDAASTDSIGFSPDTYVITDAGYTVSDDTQIVGNEKPGPIRSSSVPSYIKIKGKSNFIGYVKNQEWKETGYDERIIPQNHTVLSAYGSGLIEVTARQGDNTIYTGKGAQDITVGVDSYFLDWTVGDWMMYSPEWQLRGKVVLNAPLGTNRIYVEPVHSAFSPITYGIGAQSTSMLGDGYRPYKYPIEWYDGDRYRSQVVLSAKENEIAVYSGKAAQETAGVIPSNFGKITITATEGNNCITVGSKGEGILSGLYGGDHGILLLTAEKGNNIISLAAESVARDRSYAAGIGNVAGDVTLSAPNGNNFIGVRPDGEKAAKTAQEVGRELPKNARYYGIKSTGFKNERYDYYGGSVQVTGQNNEVIADASEIKGATGTGIRVDGNSTVLLEASERNQVLGSSAAAHVSEGNLTIKGTQNILKGGDQGLVAETNGAKNDAAILVAGQTELAVNAGGTAIRSDGKDSETAKTSVELTYEEQSHIAGDIKASGAGTVSIKASGDEATMNVVGNVTAFGESGATKGGAVTMDLQNASYFEGTADTGLVTSRNGYDVATGTIDVTLGEGALWKMTGSSAVTSLSGKGSTVYFKDGGDALEIGTLAGSHTFAMDLDFNDNTQSDMLYIEKGTSDAQTLFIKNIEALDKQMSDGDRVRFATVKDSRNEFVEGRPYYVAHGVTNDALTVRYADYDSDALNDTTQYNGDTHTKKPSTDTVAETYGGKNVYLEKKLGTKPNAGGASPDKSLKMVWRHVSDLDTFTNRSGESQYFTPGANDGAWARLRYQNLGIDDMGELDGNTYEMGYSKVLQDEETEKHRLSLSGFYGKTKGHLEGYASHLTVKNTGLALYDTWKFIPSEVEMDQKPAWKKGSHSYLDSYIKFHRFHTDYESTDGQTGNIYKGEYDQNIVSLSTEFGQVDKLSEKWSIVPQVQVQGSYLDSYDFTDSMGIKIDADHGWSLIGRLGVDLVRDLNKEKDQKFYLKASVLHEFLDGMDLAVSADDTYLRSPGDSQGTWGVLGVGYTSQIGKNQQFYIDVDRYFGNDFARTYNIRAGLNWKF